MSESVKPDKILPRKKKGPTVEINEKQLAVLCRLLSSLQDCADFFNCHPNTIMNRVKEWGYESFCDFRRQKMAYTRYKLRRMLLKRAEKSDACLIFALKNFDNFSDNIKVQETPKLEAPVKVSFSEFCEKCGYPKPFEKQIEMKDFVLKGEDPRMLMGARGYGKTDYCVVLGIAYELYLDQSLTFFIVTKSEERNASMVKEIARCLTVMGIELEKENSECLRLKGLVGKDHSVSSATIGSNSFRGRHPKMIILDDPVTEEDVSEATRKRLKRVYSEICKLTQNVAIIGQPVHKYDLYGDLKPLIQTMAVPHGTIPELDHDLEAQRLAGVSEASIKASYFLEVESENPMPFENIKFLDEFPKGDSVAFIDPSFKGGDFTALSICRGYFDGVAVKGRTFKKAWNHCIDEIKEELIKSGVKRLAFECNSLGDMPLTILREAFSPIGVVGINSIDNKHSRIMACGVYAHLIHLSKDSDQEYKTQVQRYEYGAKNDDAPDSLASLLKWIGLIRGKEGKK